MKQGDLIYHHDGAKHHVWKVEDFYPGVDIVQLSSLTNESNGSFGEDAPVKLLVPLCFLKGKAIYRQWLEKP